MLHLPTHTYLYRMYVEWEKMFINNFTEKIM